MKPQIRTLGVIGATVVTAGLALGLSFTGSSAATGTNQTTPPTISMPMSQMPDMDSMMTGDHSGMAAMMGSADMSAMHSMMHEMMRGTIDDEHRAQCDEAHAAMTGAMTTAPAQGQSQHEAHHDGTES